MSDFSNSLPAGTLLQGSQFSYRIIKTLGQGTFGITYLAELVQDPNAVPMLVCIKEFFMSDINGRTGSAVTQGSESSLFVNYRHKFVREAKNLARIHHDNVVKVIELFEANGTSYYSMSYIAGGSLNLYIEQKGTLSEKETLDIASKVADALGSLHDKGMVHLDIKPGNIMMLAGETPVLIDFGLSKNFDNQGNPESSTSIGGGTPGYAPLEQSSYTPGEGVPATMDVYALGATMYKMLTGQRPPVASEVFNMGFPAQPLIDKGISPAVIEVIRKAMSPSRDMRYPSMKELKKAIETANRGEGPVIAAGADSTVYGQGNQGAMVTQPSVYGGGNGNRPPVNPTYVPPPPGDSNFTKKKSHTTLYIVLACILIPIVLFILLAIFSGDDSGTASGYDTDTMAADTVVAVEAVPASDTIVAATETPAEEAKSSSSEQWVMTGDMQGFPIKLVLNWNGDVATGTYYNINYKVQLRITEAYMAEGTLFISFGKGKEAYEMDIYEESDGVWKGECSSKTTGKTLPVNLRM